jgi:putative oxidoreductase
MATGRLTLRVVLGGLFVGHGTQKLLGWFGGGGLKGTSESFEALGLRPGRRHAIGAGLAEAGGGLLLALGMLTPVAAATLTGVMTTAIKRVHAKNGIWSTEGGAEYNAVVIAALALLVEAGPGRISLDARLFPRLKGSPLALASVAGGAAAALLNERLFVEPPAEAPREPPVGREHERAAHTAGEWEESRETEPVAAAVLAKS